MQRPDPNMSTAERALRLAILLGFTEADGKTPCMPKELTADEATAREPIIQNFINTFAMQTVPPYIHNFAADFLHQLLTTYRSSPTVAQVAHLVPVLLQVCATPHFLRYLRLTGPEAFVNDHNKVLATFDVESMKPPSSGLTPSAIHKILNSTLLFTSLLAFQTRLYKSTCRILSTDLPTLDPVQLAALFDTIDRVRRSLGPTAAALKKEGGASQEAKECLPVVEELGQTIMFDGGLVKLVKEGVGLLGLSSDGSWPWFNCEAQSLGGCESGNMMACSRCHAVRYCGAKHQRADWKSHKSDCFTPKPLTS